MPITDELKSINRDEAAGFTPEQAKAIVEVQEDSIQRGFDRFVEVLDARLGEIEARLHADIESVRGEVNTKFESVRTEIHSVRADLLRDQRELMLRFAALVSLIALVTGAVVKFL